MSTPIPLHSAPDSPQLSTHHHGSPTPNPTPLNLPLHANVITQSAREPPHFSSLVGKSLCLDKHHAVLVEEVIAEGGFGVIFLVKNSGEKVKYALKRVVVNSMGDLDGVLGEVAVMSLISQKTPHLLRSLTHVIHYYPPGTYEVQNLMPLCSKNLLQVASTRMQKNQIFEPQEILQILTHVSSGLQYLHSAGIIHRDIKIENILVLEELYVLSDFGSATVKMWDPQVDSITAIQEDLDKNTTLQYRSPEMVDLYGGRGRISIASDIWALGVCGFKLMSFKDPFESILAIQNRNLNWSVTKSRYPDNLVLLIECLLCEQQSVRPSVDEVIKITTSGSAAEWGPLNVCASRIEADKKRIEQEASVRRTTQAANVVMETTVTPRQRPKRGVNPTGNSVAVVSNSVGLPLVPPPKSPIGLKSVSPAPVVGGSSVDNARFFSPPAAPQQTISPTTQPPNATPSPTPSAPPVPQQTSTPASWSVGAAPPPTQSYNPFDEVDPAETTNSTGSILSSDDDPFAAAPFDYVGFVPLLNYEQSNNQYQYPVSNYTNNPFLVDYDADNNNADATGCVVSGVTNLSFDDAASRNVSSDS